MAVRKPVKVKVPHKKPTTVKKKNVPDLTLRNLHAEKKRLETIEDRIAALSERVAKLEAEAKRIPELQTSIHAPTLFNQE